MPGQRRALKLLRDQMAREEYLDDSEDFEPGLQVSQFAIRLRDEALVQLAEGALELSPKRQDALQIRDRLGYQIKTLEVRGSVGTGSSRKDLRLLVEILCYDLPKFYRCTSKSYADRPSSIFKGAATLENCRGLRRTETRACLDHAQQGDDYASIFGLKPFTASS